MTVYTVPGAGAFKMVADPGAVNWPMVIAILFILVHLRDHGLRPDRRDPGRDVPDPHPLHRHVAALPHRQRLVRRPAAGDGVRA